ncbi:MAG TPA: tetratricopeptide repeat protein, partial [Bacteroidia bacterium]
MRGINLYIFFSLSFLPALLGAQNDSLVGIRPSKLKSFGKNAAMQGDPLNAIPYLEKYLKYKPNDSKTVYLLAGCYMNTRDYMLAQETYKKAYDLDHQKFVLALFYEATMLKMLGDYDKAKEIFSKFIKEYKTKPLSYKKLAISEIQGCDTAKSLLAIPSKVIVSHMDTSINKVNMELSPISLNDSTFIYASLRTNKKEYYYVSDTARIPVRKFYYAVRNKGEWKYKGEWNGSFNSADINTGNGSFSPDGKRFYFTRCKQNWKNQTICSIYVSTLTNGAWSEPVILNKKINDPNYTSTQPTVEFDAVKKKELIYFASNRPNGKGGMDIWFTAYDEKKNTYSNPKNAGTKINTLNDEVTPFFDQETHTLFYSSNGKSGIGGLDIYKSVGSGTKWSEPVNVGSPINSSSDDTYYSVAKNRQEGFFVSNRKGGNTLKNATCCDDIYSFKLKQYVRIGVCGTLSEFEKDSLQKLVSPNTVISVYYLDKKNNNEPLFIKSMTTDSAGKYCLTLEQGNLYKIVATKDGFFNNQYELSTKNINESK